MGEAELRHSPHEDREQETFFDICISDPIKERTDANASEHYFQRRKGQHHIFFMRNPSQGGTSS